MERVGKRMSNESLSRAIYEIFDSLDEIRSQAISLETVLVVEQARGQAAEAAMLAAQEVEDAVHSEDAGAALVQSPWFRHPSAEVLGTGEAVQSRGSSRHSNSG
jgi:hypothetical protein